MLADWIRKNFKNCLQRFKKDAFPLFLAFINPNTKEPVNFYRYTRACMCTILYKGSDPKVSLVCFAWMQFYVDFSFYAWHQISIILYTKLVFQQKCGFFFFLVSRKIYLCTQTILCLWSQVSGYKIWLSR